MVKQIESTSPENPPYFTQQEEEEEEWMGQIISLMAGGLLHWEYRDGKLFLQKPCNWTDVYKQIAEECSKWRPL